MHKIINKYIIREIAVPFFMTLLVFTFVLLMGRILQLMDLTVNKGVGFFFILKLILYLMPSFLVITVPISLLIAILFGLGRLSSDNEIIVLKSSGFSLYQLLSPVATVSFFAFLITAVMGFFLVPYANFATKSLLFSIAKQKASIGIKEKVFNDDFPGLVLYAEKIPIDGDFMEGVFISDNRTSNEPTIIIAKKGYLVSSPDSVAVTLRLKDGSTHAVDENLKIYKKMVFSSYDVNLDLSSSNAQGKQDIEKSSKEMTFVELIQKVRTQGMEKVETRELIIEINNKITIPLSCIVFGILGIPLGIIRQRSGKSRGFIIGLFVIMIYYVLSIGGEAFGETGKIPLVLGAWLPIIVLGSFGIILFYLSAQECSFNLKRTTQKVIHRRQLRTDKKQ